MGNWAHALASGDVEATARTFIQCGYIYLEINSVFKAVAAWATK